MIHNQVWHCRSVFFLLLCCHDIGEPWRKPVQIQSVFPFIENLPLLIVGLFIKLNTGLVMKYILAVTFMRHRFMQALSIGSLIQGHRIGPLVRKATIATLDAQKSRNMAFFLTLVWTGTDASFQTTGFFQRRLLYPVIVTDNHGPSLGRFGCCSSVHAHIEERGRLILFISFICIRECCHCLLVKLISPHFTAIRIENMSSPYIWH